MEPQHFERLRTAYPSKSLWTVGLWPQVATNVPKEEDWEWKGDWSWVWENPNKVAWATDGTSGAGKDPRLHRWGVIAARRVGKTWIQVASVTGKGVGGPNRVPYGSPCNPVGGGVSSFGVKDVTTDAKSVAQRVQKGCRKGSSMDIFECLGAVASGVKLTWVRSHQSCVDFAKEFGAEFLWRRDLNAMADAVVEARAASLVDWQVFKRVKAWDTVGRQVNILLGKRMRAILWYDEDEGPQVVWKQAPNQGPDAKPKATPKKGSRARKQPKIPAGVVPPKVIDKKALTHNKNALIRDVLAGRASQPCLGGGVGGKKCDNQVFPVWTVCQAD